MPLWKWSKTAASNANADPAINWAEGQAPSSVNDSARSMMARVAEWRDDISGAIVTEGTSTAYTVSSNQVFDTLAHMDGALIAFTPHATNGDTVTLAVDGLTAKPLRAVPSVELPSNSLLEGTPYIAVYNNTDGVFYLHGMTNPYQIPLAAGFDYWATTAPNSCFAFPYGQAVSRTTYATLFDKVGTTFGSGDGSTTFNLPDKRGRVSAASDTLGGATSAGRLTPPVSGGVSDSTVLGSAGGQQSVTLTEAQLPALTKSLSISSSATSTTTAEKHNGNTGGNSSGGDILVPASSAMVPGTVSTSVTSTGTVTFGGGAAHNIVQPTIICYYIMRVI